MKVEKRNDADLTDLSLTRLPSLCLRKRFSAVGQVLWSDEYLTGAFPFMLLRTSVKPQKGATSLSVGFSVAPFYGPGRCHSLPGTQVGPPTFGFTPRMRQNAVSTLSGTEGSCRHDNAHQEIDPFLCAPSHVGKVWGPSAELLIALDLTYVSVSDSAFRALWAPGVSSLYHLAPSTKSHILLCLVARWRNVIMGFSNNLSTELKELSCSPDSEL